MPRSANQYSCCVPFERRVRQREADTATHGLVRVEAAALPARGRHRPGFEPVRQQRVVLPIRGQVHRRNPARAVLFASIRARAGACAGRLSRGNRSACGPAETAAPAPGRPAFPIRPGARSSRAAPCPDPRRPVHTRPCALGSPTYRVQRDRSACSKSSTICCGRCAATACLVALPGDPLALDLVERRLPRRQPERQQIAARPANSPQSPAPRPSATSAPRAGPAGRNAWPSAALVGQDGRADELGGVAGGLHLAADLPGQGLIEARQAVGEYRRSRWLRPRPGQGVMGLTIDEEARKRAGSSVETGTAQVAGGSPVALVSNQTRETGGTFNLSARAK